MTKKSVLELLQEKIDGEDLELSREQKAAIEYFQQGNESLSQRAADVAAEVILGAARRKELGGESLDINGLMDISSMTRAYFDGEEFEEAMGNLNFQDLEPHLTDVDFASKFLIVDMLDKARYDGQDEQKLISDLAEGLRGSSAEKKDFLISQGKERFADMGKASDAVVLDVEEETHAFEESVYRSSGIFLSKQVFIPMMRESSPAMSRVSSMESFGISEHGVKPPVSEQPATPFIAAEDEAEFSRQSSDNFYQEPVQFLQEMPDEQRNILAERAAEAVNQLEQVEESEKGKYSMSDDDPSDTVEITKDEDGLYTIKPGDKFTGVIKMKREVAEGEPPSFDVIEFENGVMVSGVEGARGESKIKNLVDLQKAMVSSHVEALPLFVANSREAQEELFAPYKSLSFGATQTAHMLAEQEALRGDGGVQRKDWKERRYELRGIEKQVLAKVGNIIEATEKKGMYVPLVGNSTYIKEQKGLVQGVTAVVMNSFAGQTDIHIGTLKSNQAMVLHAANRVVSEHIEELEGILGDSEVFGKPDLVKERFEENKALIASMAREVQVEYENAVARDDLRKEMEKQMQGHFPAETNVLGAYTTYRDTVVKHMVNQAMANFPEELEAKTIKEKQKVILADFHKAYEGHDGNIRQLLQSQRSSWITSPKVGEARGAADLAVWEEVARDTVGYNPISSQDAKKQAVEALMKDIESSVSLAIKPATWAHGLRDYWVERNAVAKKMLQDIREQLNQNADITTEMLYKDRDSIIAAAKEEVSGQQGELSAFLGKSENKNKKAEEVAERWVSEGSAVTKALGDKIADAVKSAPDNSEALLDSTQKHLHEELLKVAKSNVDAKRKPVQMTPFSSNEYYVERDALAQMIVDQVIEDLNEKGVSGVVLKENQERIVKSFTESLGEHSAKIQDRLEHIYQQQATFNVGHSVVPSARREQIAEEAQDILRERKSEVVIVDDIVEKFNVSVKKIVNESRAHKEAKRVIPNLSGSLVKDDGDGKVSAQSTPRSSRSSTHSR